MTFRKWHFCTDFLCVFPNTEMYEVKVIFFVLCVSSLQKTLSWKWSWCISYASKNASTLLGVVLLPAIAPTVITAANFRENKKA